MGIFFFFSLGLIVGSFLNVVALRLETGTDFIRGRSACPQCQSLIAWYDNIPLFSFFFLRGKCRSCKAPIPWRYPLVELGTGLVYAGTFWLFLDPVGTTLIETVWLLGLFSLLIIIGLYDAKTMEIPVLLLQVSAFWTIVALLLLDWSLSTNMMWAWDGRTVSGLLGALGAWIFFAALSFFSKETWMGWGDSWLAAIIGLAVGIGGVFFALTLSFAIGAIFSCILLFRKKAGMTTQVPFGPFLVAGLISYFFLSRLDAIRYGSNTWLSSLFS
ncbi:MAG: prepilin peptidase [Candidatus Moranbacteria bacterium]|jgi:prepilin signal peptidase PulO-like enzyme (type II secretory pathway)|nr:prepilin peptidase [Candidatus Moranbacteria bacterium]